MSSALYEVRETELSGRGVFAIQNIPKGTSLLETSAVAAWVIYDEYAKEVCAQCYAYDRGKAWKLRENDKGLVFCSENCQAVWHIEMPQDACIAREEIQKLMRRKRPVSNQPEGDSHGQPSVEIIENHWGVAEIIAENIRACRTSTAPNKEQRKALRLAHDSSIEESYVVSYILEALIHGIAHPESWKDLNRLAEDVQPYKNLEDLIRGTKAYLTLLTVVPITLLPHINQSDVRSLQRHSSHNVFGIRSLNENDNGEEGDAGSECFGYGLWPLASYWNHSCAPNVQKQRIKRMWRFWATRDISIGEELCITYLGGGERSTGFADRKAALKDVWGFDCACSRCRIGCD